MKPNKNTTDGLSVTEDTFKKGEIVSISMLNGWEVMGSFVSQDNEKITLNDPMMPVQVPSADQKSMGMGLQAPMMTIDAKSDVAFSKEFIISKAVTGKDLATKFKEATTGTPVPTIAV